MQILELIKSRRSIGKVTGEMPSKDLLHKILEAGTWAPNHHLTEPWKFFVLTGGARERLGDAMADALKERMDHPESRESQISIENERKKPLRAPLIVAVAVVPSEDPIVEEIEEIEAVAAAVQNMLLVAHSLGLAAIHRTGKGIYTNQVKEHFGLKGRERLVGLIYLGYPAAAPPKAFRTSFRNKTVWLK